jgi:preprotein translocase subunit SecE
MPDTLKIIVAAAVLLAGVTGFYYLPELLNREIPTFVLALVVVASVVLALGLLATSEKGAQVINFAKGSRTEVRKMIWPTRKETVQGTTLVIIMVILVGLLLWAFDWVIFSVIYDFILAST